MGQKFSQNLQLPTPIKQADLENSVDNAIQQYRNNLRELGFAVIEMKEIFMSECADYRSLCSNWFYNNKFEDKLKYEVESEDEIMKQMGRKQNIGYILTKKKKEYLKFKSISKRMLFPHQQIYDKFVTLSQLWQSFNELTIDIIFSETIEHPKTHEYVPLMTSEERENLKYFTQIHSSISLIHYFNKKYDESNEVEAVSMDEYETSNKKEDKKEDNKEEEDKKENKEKKQIIKNDENKYDMETQISNRTTEIPLGEHVDTGLLTYILCSDIVGLDILDRKTNKYFPCEKYYSSNKHMFVIAGKKMEIFSDQKLISSTWHQVRIPVSSERFSLLYFVEIQKEG